MAHTLPIETRRQAESRALNTLFQPIQGKTATKHETYDAGKYGNSLRGREVEVPEHIAALYSERRKDSGGPYWTVRCICTE